jgi:sarcosine oxidase subunit alpha
VQGPRARALLEPLVEGIAFDTLPHMGVASCRVLGQAARLFRVSFTGELGYEVNVPAGGAAALWRALLGAGAVPYGTEAMHVLRAEKGSVLIGQEADGTATPDDLGLGWMVPRGKSDCIGQRSLALPELARAGRPQLVGVRPLEDVVPEEGAQLLDAPESRRAAGRVSSAYPSAALGRPVVLGMLEGGRGRMGERVFATRRDGPPLALEVVSPVAWDAAGERLRG